MTVTGDRCLLGHPVDPATVSSTRGRRARITDPPAHRAIRTTSRQRPPLPRPLRRETIPELEDHPIADWDPEPERVPVGVATGEQPAIRLDDPPPVAEPPRPRIPAPIGLIELNPTIETVERMWDDDVAQPLEEWKPSDFEEAPRLNTSMLVTVGLVIFAVFALWTGISELLARQDARLELLHRDTVALADVVASVHPDSARERLAEIDTYARTVFDRADELALGDPDRALAIEAAGEALDLTRALGDAFAYQTAFAAVADRPALPTSAEPEKASDAAERLVMWSTSVTDVLSGVPATPPFAAHREAGTTFTEEVDGLRSRYLDALRDGEPGTASGALIELDAGTQRLRDSLDPAVARTLDDTDQVAISIRRAAGRMSAAGS